MAKLRDYLELARVSNLPTVWSNVLMGVAVGGVAAWATDWWPVELREREPLAELFVQLVGALPLMIGMSLLYVGGMVLNDAMDAPIDATEDPGRPIPSGRIPRRRAWAIAAVLLLAGALVPWLVYSRPAGVATLGLVACIVTYNALHHKGPTWRLLMGVCRFALVFAAGLAAGVPEDDQWAVPFGAGVAVMAYTWVISALAASESLRGDTRRKLVMRMIAGMPLLDAAILLFLWQWPAAIVCALCAPLTALAHRRVAGT